MDCQELAAGLALAWLRRPIGQGRRLSIRFNPGSSPGAAIETTIMKIDVHVYHHFNDTASAYLTEALKEILKKENAIMATVADLKTKVADLTSKVNDETTREASIEALLTDIAQHNKDLAAQLAEAIANSDPAGIQQVADVLDASSAQLTANIGNLTAAIDANTTP